MALYFGLVLPAAAEEATSKVSDEDVTLQQSFHQQVQPLLKKYCFRCHSADDAEAGIRVDQLRGELKDAHLGLWNVIRKRVVDEAMPPEGELQLTAVEREFLSQWIEGAVHVARSRERDKNGSVRRLTVAQYRNTLRDLLGIEDNLTDILPADGVSKDGFLNNGQTLLLSPLLLEAYFEIAEKALDLCIVDEDEKPVIQNFRVDLGAGVNPEPYPDELVLGAASKLLSNDELLVTQLIPKKPFEFIPFRMRTTYRFIEGYRGNDTVRGWREYDSIYHAVFAGMRGTNGYPKGLAHQAVPVGLLLRPAIPSAELFAVESTYGPRANFKISLRELPDVGRFRVTVKAAKYDDGLLLASGAQPQQEADGAIVITSMSETTTVHIDRAGIYQADVHLKPLAESLVMPDGSRLHDGLKGAWNFDGSVRGEYGEQKPDDRLTGRVEGEATFVDSPFGQALSVDGASGFAVIPRSEATSVGDGDFTVAAWIHPRELRQGGIIGRGGYDYAHGWVFDMADWGGMIRIQTANADGMPSGTVESRPGAVQAKKWQHVAVVIRRGNNASRIYVNGFQVGAGNVKSADLNNPEVDLHVGRVPKANFFSGEIDDVRLYGRALDEAELQALVEPGRKFAVPPPEGPKNLYLQLGDRYFAGLRQQSAFLVARLPSGPLEVKVRYGGNFFVERLILTPLSVSDELARRFATFEQRSPNVGVHVGLRRDCGSALNPVGSPQRVESTELREFAFEGVIANFPNPHVEKDNVNYLAGIREIGVRSEYTDGRDMPRLVVRSVEFEGPLYDFWPPETHRSIFIESENEENRSAYAREIIRRFATRAFRRPITEAEDASTYAVWENSFAENGDFERSIKAALLVVLTSPQFLFVIENSETPEPEPLDAYELASKLSYFLWNTAPDEDLLQHAAANTLQDSLDSEIDRMLRDPRVRQFAEEFVSQWFALDKLDVVEVDHQRYPKLTRDAKAALREEPVQFVLHLIRHNMPIRYLIESKFIVANEIVANYYDLGKRTERGFEFVTIRHEDDHLGGVLSQAGVLAGLSDGRESNPVKRGAWLARKIIAEPPEDPPPNVPSLPEGDGAHLTLREKLERHRNQKGCANCHAGIDPWGLPLEEFDAGGRFKRDQQIDASSTLPDKSEVAGANGLKAYLANGYLDQVAFSALKHLATYATGRTLSYNEIDLLKTKGVELKPSDYRMQDLIRFVIQSELFLEK